MWNNTSLLWILISYFLIHTNIFFVFSSVTGGQFDNPFDVGVQIRGILNDDHEAEMVYDGLIHNRTRVLHCSQV